MCNVYNAYMWGSVRIIYTHIYLCVYVYTLIYICVLYVHKCMCIYVYMCLCIVCMCESELRLSFADTEAGIVSGSEEQNFTQC